METSKARPCREMDLLLYLLAVTHVVCIPPNSSSVLPPVPLPHRRYFTGASQLLQDAQRQPHSLWVFIFPLGLSLPRRYPRSTLAPSPWPEGAARCLCAWQGTGPHVAFQLLQKIPEASIKKKKRQAGPAAPCQLLACPSTDPSSCSIILRTAN